jgi:excinuclease ABC subunit A
MDDKIAIKNAHIHNLKSIDINIPRDQMVVLTGVSGSGKSSLAIDTIYAEGQRRYIESLSSYARQFLGKIDKPAVDSIKGIPPAIAIEQHVNKSNPRSTVGTSTEIYDYLKLLFARIGKTISPKTKKQVKKHTVKDVLNLIKSANTDEKLLILAPIKHLPLQKEKTGDFLNSLIKEGMIRLEIDGKMVKTEDLLEFKVFDFEGKTINIVIDRLKIKTDNNTLSRLSESIETAFKEGHGACVIKIFDGNDQPHVYNFSNRFEEDGVVFEEPSINMFSFNNPLGACPECEGYGKTIGIDEDKVVPNKTLSIYEDAILCWVGEKMQQWKNQVIYNADKCSLPIHKPYNNLSQKEKKLLWNGCKYFKGIYDFFNYLEAKKYKIQNRIMLARYRGKTECKECNGTRLKKESAYVQIRNKNIQELINLPIDELNIFFNELSLTNYEWDIASRILEEIRSRIFFLMNVGLSYLTLNRLSSTLSGGESQRINLAKSLGSSLVGSLYILDEPSIGLHPRDNHLLIKVLQSLRDMNNTVLVVEHDEDIIKSADQIIDMGPYAGKDGGNIVFQGTCKQLLKEKNSLTANYFTGEKTITIPQSRRKWNSYIEVKGARENNLKNIDVKFPLNTITVVTGVSGSGKSTLIGKILYPAVKLAITKSGEKPGDHDMICGDTHLLSGIDYMDQNPIGKSSRSNPVTYIKAYDEIRKLFASQQIAKQYSFGASHFSFNTPGGRCEECQGEGIIKVEMQFMADVNLICESCNGKRFKDEVLDVKYKGVSISGLLNLTVKEAIDLFTTDSQFNQIENKILKKLNLLSKVGLSYLKLGQASSTLSGGESQRLKLATYLIKEEAVKPLLFVFDEPSTGLHFHDIEKLLSVFNALIELGHSVIIIEHNLDIIKSADWVIDLGLEGGKNGGSLIFEGTPEGLAKDQTSHTGNFLSKKMN